MKRQFLFHICIAILLLAGPWLAGQAAADIQVEPMSHDFGSVAVGGSVTATITVTNVPGIVTQPLVIHSIYLESCSSPDFEITVNPDGGLILQVGESADIEITFTPSAEGRRKCCRVIELVFWSIFKEVDEEDAILSAYFTHT